VISPSSSAGYAKQKFDSGASPELFKDTQHVTPSSSSRFLLSIERKCILIYGEINVISFEFRVQESKAENRIKMAKVLNLADGNI
jgi:hypothetical protein